MMKYWISVLCLLVVGEGEMKGKSPQQELQRIYEYHCNLVYPYTDTSEHMPLLQDLASECSCVTEIGLRTVISTWALIYGLSKNNLPVKKYIGIDCAQPSLDKLLLAQQWAQKNDIIFKFIKINDMNIKSNDISTMDMLFIDSLHTYCHLMYELEKFSPHVTKYIVMHDTSAPWGDADDTEYRGDYSEYPIDYDRTKRGLWSAVQDFLVAHPEWYLQERRTNSFGLTVLKRIVQNT